MKEIKISEEDYKFLKECKELLNTQDNRCTANPIFCIQDTKQICGMDSGYSDNWEWVAFEWDHKTYSTDKELYDELIEDNHFDKPVTFKEFEEEISYCDNIRAYGLDHIEKIYSAERTEIEDGATFSFFEIDSIEHLKANHYHYSDKAITYACSSWRSPRMNKLRKLLMELDI